MERKKWRLILLGRRVFIGVVALFLLLAAWHGGALLYAQELYSVGGTEALYREAYALYRAKLYASAEVAFDRVLQETVADGSSRRADAAFYRAMCALRLGRVDGEYRVVSFLEEYQESPYVAAARFELGLLRCREDKWEDAIAWFEQTDVSSLGREESAERDFKLGYAYFTLGRYEAAKPLFIRVKDSRTYYRAHATYFYGHIAYTEGNYATALEEFVRIAEDPSFSPIVPYYVAQIHYKRGEYDRVAEYVPQVIDNAAPSRQAELLRLLGDSQYRIGEDSASLLTWQRYMTTTDAVSREDNYVVGMLHYRLTHYPEAASSLARVATEEDAYTQNANYYLGDCYLKMGDKSKARKAFEMASRLSYDSVLQEDALFTYSKLTYELRSDPLEDAVAAFTRYLDAYPNSPRANEAYSYLGMAYASTKNYQKALDALGRIEGSDMLVQQAIQRAAYYRGVELYQNLKYKAADSLFAYSLSQGSSVPGLRARALYWRGEAQYRMHQYALAAKSFREFRGSAGAFTQEEYVRSAYNLGYCQYKMKKYSEASDWFRQYVSAGSGSEPVDILTDAYCRLGDCHYVQRAYWPGIEAYSSAVSLGGSGADYALFQEGFSYGLVERSRRKVEILRRFEHEYESSSYRPEALYELGATLQAADSLASAQRYYEMVASLYPTSSKASMALVQLGLVAYAQRENERAVGYFQKVVKDYPGTPQANEALLALERVYQGEGKVQEYFAYLDRLGLEQHYSQAQRDSLVFAGAEGLYTQGQFSRAILAFENYLREYPNGHYALSARYYLGESFCAQRDSGSAISPLRYVASVSSHRWEARALQLLGEAYESRREWRNSLDAYVRLEAVASSVEMLTISRTGRLRMAVALERDDEVIESAKRLLSSEKLRPELSLYANYQLGGALRRQGRLEEAYQAYASLGSSTGSAVGAEARYQMVWIRYSQRNWGGVREEVMSFSRVNTPHQYWLGKSFILLAKAYAARDDFFQAKATLQSVVDNYANSDDGVVEEARRELAALLEAERTRQAGQSADTIKFEFQR